MFRFDRSMTASSFRSSSRSSSRKSPRSGHSARERRREGPGRVAMESLEHRTLMSVVLPGGAVALPGTTAAAQPALAGTVVRDALLPVTVTDPGGHVIFRGHLQDRVVRENVAGTLDFYQTI